MGTRPEDEAGSGSLPPSSATPPDVLDDDAGLGALLFHRIRARRLTMVTAGAMLLALALHAMSFAGGPRMLLLGGGMLVTLTAGLLAFVSVGKLKSTWRPPRFSPAELERTLGVRWRDRPGWPGPRPDRVEFLAESLRLVGHEWDPWDVAVLAATVIVCTAAGITNGCGFFFLPAAGWTFLYALGVPRKRRVEVDVPWQEVERAEVRGVDVLVTTRLPEPAARLHFQTLPYAHAYVLGRLAERLGERFATNPGTPTP